MKTKVAGFVTRLALWGQSSPRQAISWGAIFVKDTEPPAPLDEPLASLTSLSGMH